MDRVDSLDMSVFGFADGMSWAKRMLDAEMLAAQGEYDFSEYPLLAIVAENPDRLRTHTVPRGGARLSMADAFMDVMSRAPASTMVEYQALRDLARRFGSGANDWVERRDHSVVGFKRREERTSDSGHEFQLPLSDIGYGKFTIFNLDENFAPNVFDFMVELTAQSGGNRSVGDILFFNLVAGFAATITPGISVLSPEADDANVALSRIFGGNLHSVPHVALSRAEEHDYVSAMLPRNLSGYSIFVYLEPFLRSANVQVGRVLVEFAGSRRPEGEHLLYRYGSGARRRGVTSDDGVCWRVEMPVESIFKGSDVFGNIAGVARACRGSADIYIEGSTGTARMDGWRDVGSPMGFQPGVVDLVATGPGAQAALNSAISALSSVPASLG